MGIKCPKCQHENPDDTLFCGKCGTKFDTEIDHTKTLKSQKIDKPIAGKYKILEELGRGGMGIVYKAKDTKLKRNVALKFLPAELMQDKQAKARFFQEAQAAAALNHPNICIIHEVDEADDQTFIAMEFIKGQTLKGRIASGKLEIDEAVKIVTQIGEGLNEAHAKGIVHRDIKPANIILTDKGTAKIMDFGIAKLVGGVDLTKPSTLIGTVAYMSPEQAMGDEVDLRTDIWSLGAMFYEMLTAERPFQKSQEQALIFAILNDKPTSLSLLRSDVPAHIEQVIDKALAKKASERYQNIQDLIQDLKLSVALPKAEKSIAVLPFEDMSPDKDQEYFCDGIAEELINSLTKIKDLKVVARTSAFSLKGKSIKIQDIGKELNVDTILEGSVRKSGDRIRITAQLINVRDGYHHWSERFDRKMDDIFAIQDEISLAIVEHLRIKLLEPEKKAIVKRYTEDVEVYENYLMGKNFLWGSIQEVEKGLGYLNKAIEMDPNYAPAYSAIADHYSILGLVGAISPADAYQKTKSFTEKALEIDDEFAEAHTQMANIRFYFEWDWQAAEREYKHAIQLNPNSADVYTHYLVYLGAMGRTEELIVFAQRQQRLDPLSSQTNNYLGWAYWAAHKFEDAIIHLKKAIELRSDNYLAHANLAWSYYFNKMYPEAIAECEKAEKLDLESMPVAYAETVMVYAGIGKRNKVLKIVERFRKLSSERYIDPFCFVFFYIGLGEKDKALEWLDKAYNERSLHMVWIKWMTTLWFKGYDSDPRYQKFLQEMNFPE